MTLSAEDRFNVEVIKLLLQVAWHNHELDERERKAILTLGKNWKVPEEELKALEEKLVSGKDLPAPDVGLLRTRPEKVLACARALSKADGLVDDEEKELIQQLAAMLGVQLE